MAAPEHTTNQSSDSGNTSSNTPPPCPKCASTNTTQVEVYEDSYGALITEYDCLACKHEFRKTVGGA